MAEEWIEKVFEVQRVSDRIILVKLIVGQRVVTFLSVYAPQSGLSDEVKDLFFDRLRAVTARIPASEFLIPCGDWNGHVGHAGTGYREVHGGMGYGRPEPDVEGERILEYALAFDLLLGNTCFKKRDSHLITYKSGNIPHSNFPEIIPTCTSLHGIIYSNEQRNAALSLRQLISANN